MSKNKELILEERYIHTGNSGVTISVERDVKRPTRAILKVKNGSHGAFSTEMEIRGNDYNGMTAIQLRDLALCFLEAAECLDIYGRGEEPRYRFAEESASIVSEKGGHSTHGIPGNLERHLKEKLRASGMNREDADTEAGKMIRGTQPSGGGCDEGGGSYDTDEKGQKIPDLAAWQALRAPKRDLDYPALIMDRIRYLVNKASK